MNTFDQILPDDPRLTTYALGEMEPAERAEFEELLKRDASARAAVAEISGTAHRLGVALAGEPVPQIAQARFGQAAIIQGRDLRKFDGGPLQVDNVPNLRRGAAKLLHFPQMYYTITGLAAACFMIGFILWQAGDLPPPRKHYTEIDLSKFTSADAMKSKVATAAVPEPSAAEQPSANRPADAGPVLEVGLQPMEKERAEPGAAPAQMNPGKVLDELRADTGTARATIPVSLADKKIVPMALNAEVALAASNAKDTLAGNRISAPPRDNGSVVPADQPQFSGASGGMVERQTPPSEGNTETYDRITDNAFAAVKSEPRSTFAIDVDTAAYANVRRFIQGRQLPPRDAVRIEELVNYFPYHYVPPETLADERNLRGEDASPSLAKTPPFAAHLEVASAPWAPEHRLVRIGLKGREVSAAARPAANLVFLLDVSGSMNEPNKLPLVKESLRLLVDKLRPDDQVAIVVYAGASGLALPSTPVARKREIIEAINALQPGGSTNGALGIQLAYDIAKANFVRQGINRIVLCTDGDFNVGVTSRGDLTRLVEERAKGGVCLTVLGFGMGNYKDATLGQLADKGHGNYGYIDSRREAQKLLVEQAGGTLMPIAKDVKIQVEFNPAQVQAYRLIGYENRLLRPADFNDDRIDAGVIGAGHTVTALYEVVPTGVPWVPESSVDALKYQTTEQAPAFTAAVASGQAKGAGAELLTLKLRYKEPEGDVSTKLEFTLRDGGRTFDQASADFKFAAAVAAFGMVLRDSPHKGEATFAKAAGWAQGGLVDDAGGYRAEFVGLVGQAERLSQN